MRHLWRGGVDGQATRREAARPRRDPGSGAPGGGGRACVEWGRAVGLPRRRRAARGSAADHAAHLGSDLEAAPTRGRGLGTGRRVRASRSHRDGRLHRRRGVGHDRNRAAGPLSPRRRSAARRVLPRGDAARGRRPRAAPAAAGHGRCRDRARRGRGDDEAARHRLPPEPARGLADRDPQPSAADAAGLRARAIHHGVIQGREPHGRRPPRRVRVSAFSHSVRGMIEYLEPVLSFIGDATYQGRVMRPEACDFRFGNPQEMPLPQIQQALTKWATPQDKDWFAYKFSDPQAVKVAVESLRERVGINFDPRDIAMTTGAFGALASTLRAVLDPGDEVIYLSPPWFFYVPMILACGAKPVRVDFTPPQFELPVDAIEWHLTPQTRAIIVNSPHNPSGRVFTPDELERLADVLEASHRPIYLISDESYSRILFDGREFHSPVS